MDIEEQRKHKQDYLRDEIINKDYDGQQFADYCIDVKGDIDIDNWTFNDLVELVSSFIKAKQQRMQEENDPFSGVFDKNKEVKGIEEFSSFGGVGTGQQTNPTDLNFEFVPDTKLNSLDLDFLSMTFLGGTAASTVTQPPKKIEPPPKPKQSILPPPTKVEPIIKPDQPIKKWKEPESKIKVPQQVANKLIEENKKVIVSTQQPVVVQAPQKTIVQPPVIPVQPTSSHNDSPPKSPAPVASKKIIEEFFEKITCKKVVARSLLLNSKAEMHISGHQIVTTNMFVPDHVVYHLMTVPLNIEVKRRFKDFETLRGILRKLFPSSRLPHLEKNSRLSETQPQVIKRQKYFLECFINDLLISSEFQNCRLVEEFLTMKDLDHLKKKFKEYDKADKVKGIEGLTSLSGQISIRFSGKNIQYNDKVDNYIEVSEAYYQKIRQLYEQLVGNIQVCVKTLTDLGEVFSSLESITKGFNSSVSVNQFTDLERTYKYISDINMEWANSLKAQSKLIDSDIKTRFKFEKENMSTLREILRMRASITEAYLKRSDKEKSNEKYTSTKLDDFKVGIDYPSKNITVLTYQNAYINDKTSSETERLFNELSLKLRQEFSRFSKLQENICGDIKDIWARFSK